ncbi:MAG: hypothetical protein GEU73_07910 [Chloroflexi bacterium]|nr:hypothetical protein [Chloroflexota bacterium]
MQNQPEMTPSATPGADAVPERVTLTLSTPEYRAEGPLKVSGRARYTADVRLPGMLWAMFLKSPVAHARIVSIDSSAAREVRGVHAVLTGADIGPRRFGRWLYDWPVLAYEAGSVRRRAGGCSGGRDQGGRGGGAKPRRSGV